MLRGLSKFLLGLLLLLAVSLASYSAYACWAWGDIPASELEQKYGDVHLRTALVDGVAIRYRLHESAQPQAPLVVLIHNHFLDMGMWDAWIPVLTPHFRVLRYDLSGHGLTGPDPSGSYTVERDVALLEGLLAQLQVEAFALVGSSLGGNIAFSLAARTPERTQALVLINSGGLKRQSSRSGREIPAWADHIMPLIPPQALQRFLSWMAADQRAVTTGLKTRFVDMWRRAGNRRAELARLRQFRTGDPGSLLAAITAPALILWGEDNPQLPVALAADFERKLTAAKSVRRQLYPQAGHLLPLERPSASARDTLNFLLSAAR